MQGAAKDQSESPDALDMAAGGAIASAAAGAAATGADSLVVEQMVAMGFERVRTRANRRPCSRTHELCCGVGLRARSSPA